MAKPRHVVPLTRKRQEWAKARGGAVFYGKPLTDPDRVEARYRATLERAIAAMTEEAEAAIRKLWESPVNRHAVLSGMDAAPSMTAQARILTNALAAKFTAFFDRIAAPTANSFVAGVDKHTKSNLHASLAGLSGGLSLKTSVITGRTKEILKASVAENVALIKSIPREYFPKLQGAVMRSITTGQGVKTVLEAVVKTGEVTKKRAALIARDQTSKATTALNASRMSALNVRKFEWLHSGGGKVPRDLHKHKLNGEIFDLDNPPVIDEKTGERGLPGQLINCGCRMIPVVDYGP